MKSFSQVPIIQSAYTSNADIQKIAAGYPVSYRHTLGMRLAHNSSEFFSEILKTNASRDYAQRTNALLELRSKLFILGMDIRLAKDLEIISHSQHRALHERLIHIRKQLCGWQKWTKMQP